ncbi:enoyl-CoA hydratase/carnithine racemase [Sedimentibacter acidaminivorans]|uniref:Enoyl-CoA hydratase/carnithine racemase n=1 Tax=Sedimentibacter acidaminivorans TaxID=913099 RepID=A0ABS4GB74_9FIRM|nr:enoyl-CoA hydratase/isomerase family protein [Sedimentibacter acidaminivorans]MBP1924922.1 enoyl-CoA hydratase/carnithine racemase [Sedimentibacter acidaminivorans]
MEYKYILFDVEQGVATISLNRPESMNSLNLEIIEEISVAVDVCSQDQNTRVVVLTGVGNVFSAGDDIKIMGLSKNKTKEEIAEIIEKHGYPMIIKKIMSLKKPVIAKVNGICYGAGGELALACDYIIASKEASFGQMYINVGLIGNTYLLPKHVGVKKALELIWTGKIISADEALGIGMINKVSTVDMIDMETKKIAIRLSKGPTLAYGLTKESVYEGMNLDLEKGLKLMTKAQGILMKTNDHKEGVAAFIEKRKAEYKGN